MKRSWVEISRQRLAENVRAVRERLPASTPIIAIVKANAYGHGVGVVAPCLQSAGIEEYAVACLEEAVELRRYVPDSPVLVLGGCLEGQEGTFREYRLTAAHFHLEPPAEGVPYELKVDTGMTRLGIPWTAVGSFLDSVSMPPVGVFSHFASAETDLDFSRLQLERFLECTEGIGCPRHLAASPGLRIPGAVLDRVRVGLVLYGVRPAPEIDYVKPVLTWKARVQAVQEVPAGRRVGYGGTFRTRRPSRLAILSAGYADGFNRRFSEGGQVRIRGRLAPTAGRVSMDLTTVDVTDIPGVEPGDQATLLEPDESSPLSANRLADAVGTISYEILTAIGPRVERVGV